MQRVFVRQNAFLPKRPTKSKLGSKRLGCSAFRPQIRHRLLAFRSGDIWEQVCCYCVVACYSSTVVLWLHLTRLTASISVSQPGNVTQLRGQQTL